MKVLMINGSPNSRGCTYTALKEVGKSLEAEGIDYEIVNIGKKQVMGCIACGRCEELGRCVFADDVYEKLEMLTQECDGILIGSPVYFASANGALCALLDRFFYSKKDAFKGKVGSVLVSCRRAGSTAALDRLYKYLTYSKMTIVTSQYWNMVHGNTPEEVMQDDEGLQTMRLLGKYMARQIKMNDMVCQSLPLPEEEERLWTNFIR